MSLRRVFYSVIIYLIFPFVILRLLWRGISNPAYRQRIPERLGLVKRDSQKPIIWIHAVSVGETIAAQPLIEALINNYPNYRILLTTTTPTGSDRVKSLFSDRVMHVYFPYDLPEIIYRFLKRIKPQIFIVVETEIWPNLYAACYKRKIPIIIVNARLSERSTKSYLKIKNLVAETLSYVSQIAVRSEADAVSFKKLGADSSKIQVTGNIKFDISVDKKQIEKGKQRKKDWGKSRPVWIAASTHEGEDEELLRIYLSLLKNFPTLLLVLIPRHPERFDRVYQLCSELHAQDIKTLRHSDQSTYKDVQVNIILGDSMGEMQSWFATADIAFIGGSLVKTGGHNPLEAIVQNVPVVSGQYMFNFEDIVTELQGISLLTICDSPLEVQNNVERLLKNDHSTVNDESKLVMQRLGGVTSRLIGIVSRYL